MKKINTRIFSLGLVVLISCGNSNTAKETTAAQVTKTPATTANETVTPSPQGDGIIGDWKLTLETYDDNHNKKLDDAERKKAFSNHYFYRFNTDGSCLINFNTSAQGAFKGHYKKKEENGKTKIDIWMDEEGKSEFQGGYTVISVNKDEMVLLESIGDHTFWIFKRAG